MDDLERSFKARGIMRGGILMLSAKNALAFIDAARMQRTPILGVDSFIITATTTQPLMEHTLDLSMGGLPDDTWSKAQHFVELRGESGFMFEVVL